MHRHARAFLVTATVPILLCLSACADETPTTQRTSTASATATATADAGPALPPALTPSQAAALPATTYDAVIPGLLPAPAAPTAEASYRVLFDTVVYAADFSTPVARIPAVDFLGQPTVVVPVETRGQWSLVLTAARQQLPSQAASDAPAPAQSAAWVPTRALQRVRPLAASIVISTADQTLSIVDSSGTATSTFPVGVGTPETPTPTRTTGYLQARYLDPAQGQSEHRIQLTSLHATTADEPYGGSDGGLIGIHFESTATGAVSHGCIRLSADAIAAVDALPLGTAVRITG